jgi:NAD(P)-dependent dehydrogenase (short-subunit alcohol dehydrogenase family)
LSRGEVSEVPVGYVRHLFDIAGRVAVVTGGGSGLGAAISVGFGQAGARVVVADINDEGAALTAQTIESQGGEAQAIHLNVVDASAVDTAADQVAAGFGSVDILVNSAGSGFRCEAEEFPEDRFDFILEVNLKGTYLCCQSFGRRMLGQGKGSIINMASIGSFVAYPLDSAYLASKGGVLQLTRSLALEWQNRGVRVNGIGPTLMESPMSREAAQRTSVTSDFITGRMLRRRLGVPCELIGTAIFLASDASDLVTGHVIMCDDGYLLG